MSEINRRAESGFRPIRIAAGESALVVRQRRAVSASMSDRAYRGLQVAFAGIPLAAGADKFLYEIADWSAYLAPGLPRAMGLPPHLFLYGVGIWEVAIGIGVALSPRVFADVLGFWLAAIIVNLLLQGLHFDIILFNFGLAAGACALARLSRAREMHHT
jgi:hypothetical protein